MKPTAAERDRHMRKIPDKAYKWMESLIDTNHRYPIYYTKKGRYATMFCTKCGKTYTECFKRKDTYEGQFEKIIDTPYHGVDTKCPYCNVNGRYRAAGRAKQPYAFKERAIMGQKTGQDFVWRVFNIETTIHPYSDLGCWKANTDITEYIRIWNEKGKKAQKDYYVWSYFTRSAEWIDKNLGGLNNIPFPYGAEYYPGTESELEKTEMFKYIPSCESQGDYEPVDYYSAAARYYKDFEFITKAHITSLTKGLISGTVSYRQNGKTPEDRLGIYKERLKQIIAENSIRYMDIYRLERKTGKHWTYEEIKQINDLITKFYDQKTVKELLQYATPGKIQKYTEKLLKGVNCDYSWQRREICREYEDYLRMRKEDGYDLSNYIYLFPKDMRQRHNELVAAREIKTSDKRKKEVNEKFKNIQSNYQKIADKYSAQAGEYIIRPAQKASEIVEEGRILHHCVGGDNYLKKHNNGQSYILFLRTIKDKDTPYITVEIKGNQIIQWYGEYDKKPNAKIIDMWLSAYTKELSKHKKNVMNI